MVLLPEKMKPAGGPKKDNARVPYSGGRRSMAATLRANSGSIVARADQLCSNCTDEKSSTRESMSPSIKKLIGTVVILIWLPIYALVAMGVAFHVLPHANVFVAFLYYALAGTLWTIPIGLMFPWMQREPTKRRTP